MKKMPAKDLRKMSVSDLESEAKALRLEIGKIRMGVELRSEKDTAKVKRAKRNLARILTVLGEKQNSEAPALKKKASSATVSAPVSA